jgi:hypothetical protein
MTRYFTLISHDDPERRETFYEDSQRGPLTLSIGWGKVNPIGSTEEWIRENIEKYYPDKPPLNVTNGANSLDLFSGLAKGDIVFVRGNASVIDVCIITSAPFYKYTGEWDDYYTKVSFVPLFGSRRFVLPVSSIPEPYREAIIYTEGRSRAMKQVS